MGKGTRWPSPEMQVFQHPGQPKTPSHPNSVAHRRVLLQPQRKGLFSLWMVGGLRVRGTASALGQGRGLSSAPVAPGPAVEPTDPLPAAHSRFRPGPATPLPRGPRCCSWAWASVSSPLCTECTSQGERREVNTSPGPSRKPVWHSHNPEKLSDSSWSRGPRPPKAERPLPTFESDGLPASGRVSHTPRSSHREYACPRFGLSLLEISSSCRAEICLLVTLPMGPRPLPGATQRESFRPTPLRVFGDARHG